VWHDVESDSRRAKRVSHGRFVEMTVGIGLQRSLIAMTSILRLSRGGPDRVDYSSCRTVAHVAWCL
jgi:hypothetical protein